MKQVQHGRQTAGSTPQRSSPEQPIAPQTHSTENT